MGDAKKFLESFDRLTPIFIGGIYRSGTTLLLRLLEGCPELLTYPVENKFVYEYLNLQSRGQTEPLNSFERLRETAEPSAIFDFLRKISIERRTSSLSLQSSYPVERNLALKEEAVQELFDEEFKKAFSRLFALQMEPRRITSLFKIWIASYFLRTGAADFSNKRAWVVKYPDGGVCYEEYRRAFPENKTIYMVRDPRDCFASMKEHWEIMRKVTPSGSTMHGESLGQFLKYYRDVRRSLKAYERRDSKVLIVEYEDLVTKPEQMMRRIAAFMGISYRDELLKPHFFGKSWAGNSSYEYSAGVPRDIDAQSIDRWEKTLKWHEKVLIRIFLKEYFKESISEKNNGI